MQEIETTRKEQEALKHQPTRQNEIALRQSGVYMLPNDTELVVGVGREGHYFLFHPLVWRGRSWIINMPIAYEISADGQIFTGAGALISWHIKDLIDTHRTLA